MLAYNSSRHAATGYSPFQMAFGFQPQPMADLPEQFPRGPWPLTIDLKKVWSQVTTHDGEHGKASQHLKVGDLVLVRTKKKPRLGKPWIGPKKVTKVNGPTSVEVEDIGRVHLCRVKFFKGGKSVS